MFLYSSISIVRKHFDKPVVNISFFTDSTAGIYVANLSHHMVRNVEMALELLNKGRKELIIAETKMVRHSSRYQTI